MELTKEELELVKIKREETAQLKAEYQKRIDKYKNNSKHIIENNSTLSDLEKKIKKIINYL